MAEGSKFLKQAGGYLSLAFVLPAATLAGWIIGALLDKLFKTHFLYIPFLILGIVSGIVQLIREVNKLGANDR